MIEIKVPRQDRLYAINKLSESILNLSKALSNTPIVNVSDCNISNTDVGISVGFDEEEYETNKYVEETK